MTRPRYTGPIPSATELEEEVAAARQRHRERLESFERLNTDHRTLQRELSSGVAETSSVWDAVSAAFGPDDVGPHLRNLMSQIPIVSRWFEDEPTVSVLEDKVEVAQRRVLQLAHHLDRLAADRAVLDGDLERLQARIAVTEEDAQLAASEILALGEEGDPAEISARESELRALQRAARRLRSVGHLHHEFLRLTEILEKSLSQLHEAACEMLETLDTELAHLATEARARDLARALSTDLSALRTSVSRVNRIATDNAVLLTENLDRLADEVDLLTPTDAEARAAEQELAAYLRNRSVADAMERARQVVAVREQVKKLTDV